MFNSSLRHVARSRPTATSIPTRPSTPKPIKATFTSRAHQRRHSSSKPPVPPNDGSHAIPASSVKTVGGPRTKDIADKRPGAESRLSKRKVAREKNDAKYPMQNEWAMKLPSVPSTQHLSEKDVCLASFFSIHRPLSISSPIPTQVSTEEFEKIFQSKPKPSRPRNAPQEVIYTISHAVENLDEKISNQQQGSQTDQGVQQRGDIIAALTRQNHDPANQDQSQHLDSQPQNSQVRLPQGVKLAIQEIARRFRPYNPPPAPETVTEAEFEAREAEAAATEIAEDELARQLEIQVQQQDPDVQTIVLNVHETPDLRDGRFFTSHQSPAIREPGQEAADVDEPQHMSYLERKQRNTKMYMISVKRQRRLKMKKHKYKKLMRKTRNLRRRQDRL